MQSTRVRLLSPKLSVLLRRYGRAAKLNAIINDQSDVRGAAKDDAQFSMGPLQGRTIAIKDNIVTTSPTTAASKTLSTYRSPFNATVVKLLRQNGATISSKTNLDEFGMGSHSQHSHDTPVQNQHRRNGIALSPGGSSGGSAVAVAIDECWAALGTDTGGSVRLPAAYTGTVGFKPSYGLISRWGVIQYANSLDTVGILAKEVDHVRSIFDTLNKYDSLDPTSIQPSLRKHFEERRTISDAKKLRIGIPLEYNIKELSTNVREAYVFALGLLRDEGHELVPVTISATRQALSAYYVLAPAEASSNLAKYDGIRYGHRTSGPDSGLHHGPPLYTTTRGEGFGPEVKRRILLGAYTLSSQAIDNYFIQAQKVRRLVQNDFDRVFRSANPLLRNETSRLGVDFLLTPTAPTLPPTVEELRNASSTESFMNDVFTVPASLAGLPAISIPVKLPVSFRQNMDPEDIDSIGLQLIGQFGNDASVLDVAKRIEQLYSHM